MNGLEGLLIRLQQAGLNIRTVFDIGAWNGDWSTRLKRSVLPNGEFFLFEANPAYEQVLASTGFNYFITVLSNPGRDFVEFYNGTNTGDSYYKETTKYYDNQTFIRLPCATLDGLIKQNNLPIPNFIKIDTQGSELDVLEGARSVIDHVDLIYTECPIVRYNSGAPNIQDYLDYFRSHDFIPVDLLETHRSEETLLQVDIMFMKRKAKEQIFGPNEYIRPWIA